MTHVTLVIALAGCALVLYLRPAKAFSAYIAVMLFYPSYLVVQLGVLDISVGRIVATALLVRCLANRQIMATFSRSRLDIWVTAFMAVSVMVPLTSYKWPIASIIENRSGQLIDTFFVYLIARLCIADHASLTTAVRCISVVLFLLALLGFVEATVGWQPYVSLRQYRPWEVPGSETVAPRYGLHRAVGAAAQPIMFGSSFVIFLPLIFSLRHDHGRWRSWAYVLTIAAIIGALSSMSSGPWMMVIMIISFLFMERFRQSIKAILVVLVVMCCAVEVLSNRRFYHVVASYANPLGGSGWHRARLIDLALEHFGEWWLAGYGGQDPQWGSSLGRGWTDITNQYIVTAVQSGLFGLITFCGILVVALQTVVFLYRSTRDPVLKSWFWALGSLIVVLMISFLSCTFFDQTKSYFYAILGIVGSSPNMLVRSSASIDQSYLLAKTPS